ncbi:hypothetical protein KCMC57_up15710 [Kitasatospora sp. CMC57]|uniref:Uncharacterized protein n=1 Tax=Kitasatospora sp. CMC57 TaxID=3231513 RepID=A0AB33JRB3_9ACTN
MSRANRDLTTITDIIEPVDQALPATVRARARSVVASYARDRDDCRLLLEALGLVAEDDT